MGDERYMTAAELADRLSVTVQTVRRWTATGRIPKVKLGGRLVRYHMPTVVAALQNGEPTPLKPRPRTPRDDLFDAIVATWPGLNAKAEGGRIGRLVNRLVAFGANPDDIPVRLARYRKAWADAADTPEALVKHWTRFSADAKPPGPNVDYELWSNP